MLDVVYAGRTPYEADREKDDHHSPIVPILSAPPNRWRISHYGKIYTRSVSLCTPGAHGAMRCLAEVACLRIHSSQLRSTIVNMRQESTIVSVAGQQLTSPLALIEKRLGDLSQVELIQPFAALPWWQPPIIRIALEKTPQSWNRKQSSIPAMIATMR